MKHCRTTRWLCVLALIALCNLPLPAMAYDSGITWPTLALGTRGHDVLALQRFLAAQGYPLLIDGVFGPGTEAAVREFQTKNGLTVNAMVGADAWPKLVAMAQYGSSGQAVCALQEQLIAKHGYSLAADCSFGPATDSAVRSFQSHMGLAVDGIVGVGTWKHLIGHFENLTQAGSSGYGWTHYGDDGADAFGTANTVAYIKRVAQQWFSGANMPRLQVGDISRPHGGYFPPHASHRNGVDFDILPIRTDRAESMTCYTDATYSRSLTQQLIDLWRATGLVDLIFFNDPNISGVMVATGHDCHIHVRLKY